jgi:hypothetical protein
MSEERVESAQRCLLCHLKHHIASRHLRQVSIRLVKRHVTRVTTIHQQYRIAQLQLRLFGATVLFDLHDDESISLEPSAADTFTCGGLHERWLLA